MADPVRPPGFEGEPERLTLEQTWQPSLDHGFLARQQAKDEAEWQAALQGTGGGQAPEQPGAPAKPSAIVEGVKGGAKAFTEGGKMTAEGIAELLMGPEMGQAPANPKNIMQSLKKTFDGLVSMGLSPFVGLGVGGGQALENANPALAHEAFATGTEALTLRTLLSGRAVADLTEDERRQFSQPMTVREALETAITLAAPAMAGKAPSAMRKAMEANKALGERGSLGPPTSRPEITTGGATPPPSTSPFAQGPKPRVNLERVGAEDSIKAAIADMNVRSQEAGLIKTDVIPRAETAAKAEAKHMTVEQALKLDYTELHVNATAIRDLRDLAFKELRDQETRAFGGDPKELAKLESTAIIAALLEQKASETATAAGRGLGAFNIISDAGRVYDREAVVKLVEAMKANMTPGDTFAARLAQLRTKQQRQVFLRQLVGGLNRGQNMFYEAWINGLLSNPVSHAANTISNATVAAWGVAERQMAGMFNVIIRDPEGVHPGEALVMTRASVEAAKQSFRVAFKAFKEEETPFGLNKMEVNPSITGEAMGLSATNPLTGVVDFMGSGIRLPSRMMMTEDAWFKWFNYVLDMEARAYREGKKQGLSGDALGDFYRTFKENPEQQAISQRYALTQTFNLGFEGEFSLAARIGRVGQEFQNLPLMRLVAPFMRTPVRISEYAWQRTPVLSLISESLYRDLASSDAATRHYAMARLGTSAMLAAVFMEYASAGVMTGGGADKKNAMLRQTEKALGRQDYAIRVGDDLYTINRLDPAGLAIGSLATYAEIAGQIPEGHRIELAAALVLAMSEAIKDKPFFMGLSATIHAIETPGKEAKTFIEQYTRTMVPFSGLVHQTTKAGIPGVMEGDKRKKITAGLTEVEQLLNVWKAGIPGLSSTLPADMNPVTGEDIMFPPGWGPDLVSPILVTSLKNDPVLAAIAQNKPNISPPPKALAGKKPGELQMHEDAGESGIPLTGLEYRELLEIQTNHRDGQGRTLYQALSDVVASDEFRSHQAGKGTGRGWLLERTYNEFKRAAIALFRERHPDFDQAVKDRLEYRYQRKAGETSAPQPAYQIAPGMTLPNALGGTLTR